MNIKTEMEAILERFKTSDDIPYKQFRKAMEKLYSNTILPAVSFDDFYYQKIVEVLTKFVFDPPKIGHKEYEQARMLEKVLIYLHGD